MDIDTIFKLVYDALYEYNWGSDGFKLGYDKDKGVLRYCSTFYDWYEMPCDYTPESILKTIIKILMEDRMYGPSENGSDDSFYGV